MSFQGTHTLGPADGTLSVKTGRSGAAAKAGHDLVLEVTSWEATLELGQAPSVALTADPTSLRVVQGTGGMQALDDGDKDNIRQTIDDEVLNRQPIEFRSTAVEPDGDRISVRGDLTLARRHQPDRVRRDAGRRRQAQRQRDAEAVGLGHEALLRAVRRAEGRGRGRGSARRRPAVRLTPQSR